MKLKLRRIGLLCIAGAALLLVGCSSAPSGGGNNAAPVNIDKSSAGYKVFAQSCASCHGQDLQGGMGPNLQHIGAQLDKAHIQNQILNGGGGMPAFKSSLSDQNVQDVVAFLSGLK